MFGLFGKKGVGKSDQDNQSHAVNAERDAILNSYEQVQAKIDRLLLHYDKVKLQIEEYITDR